MPILAQSSPGGGSLTLLYKVPAFKTASLSGFIVCNRDTADTSWRLSIAKNGESDHAAQYLYFDTRIPKNESSINSLDFDLEGGDEVRVYAAGTKVSFNLFGVISPP